MRSIIKRRAAVQLEFLMAFPFLFGAFCVVIPLTEGSLARLRTTEEVRRRAFAARHRPWEAGDFTLREIRNGMDSISIPLGPRPRIEPERSLAASSIDRKFEPMMDFYRQFLDTRVSDASFVMAGSWDHQEIEMREHTELTPPKEALYFALNPGRIGFQQLTNFRDVLNAEIDQKVQSSGLDDLMVELEGAAAEEVSRGMEQLQTVIDQLNAEIKTKNDEIQSLRVKAAELQREYRDNPFDEELNDQLRKLGDRVERLQGELETLQTQLNESRGAMNQMQQAADLVEVTGVGKS